MHHIADITRDYEGRCWTQNVQWEVSGKKIDPAQWGITQLQSESKAGLSTTPGLIHSGGNSGYAAVNLAYHLNAGRVLLLGFDMMLEGSKRHWFGDHPQGLNMASNYKNFINNFNSIVPADYGIEIWNVTRRTDLKCFPIYDLDDLCRQTKAA